MTKETHLDLELKLLKKEGLEDLVVVLLGIVKSDKFTKTERQAAITVIQGYIANVSSKYKFHYIEVGRVLDYYQKQINKP